MTYKIFKCDYSLIPWFHKGYIPNSYQTPTGTILINEDLRWEKQVKNKVNGNIVGADQGFITCLTLSDGQITKPNKHHYDLTKINYILSRKRKGSKNFSKAQEHRKNYINWSINQLNFKNIKQINLEKIYHIGYKKSKSRLMSHWTNTLIQKKVINLATELGVQVNLQDCTYRSQRCSACGLVLKKNRIGKVYSCKHCGYCDDADLNAAKNHEVILPKLNSLKSLKLNVSGFFWKENGLFDLNGMEFTVPHTNQ